MWCNYIYDGENESCLVWNGVCDGWTKYVLNWCTMATEAKQECLCLYRIQIGNAKTTQSIQYEARHINLHSAHIVYQTYLNAEHSSRSRTHTHIQAHSRAKWWLFKWKFTIRNSIKFKCVNCEGRCRRNDDKICQLMAVTVLCFSVKKKRRELRWRRRRQQWRQFVCKRNAMHTHTQTHAHSPNRTGENFARTHDEHK